MPWIISIDPCNKCNLACPLCATGSGNSSAKKKHLSFEKFREYFDQIKNYIFFVRLYNWGEPFFNKDILKMIEYSHKNNVGVVVNSNFTVVSKDIIEQIVIQKLDYLILSIDGVTQEKYGVYRKKGIISKVFENLEYLVAMKVKHQSKYPIIQWQFLQNGSNKSELKLAYEKSKELGINVFSVYSLSPFTIINQKVNEKIYDELGIDPNQKVSSISNKKCHFLWNSLNIKPTGLVDPCCAIYNDDDSFGDLNQHNIFEIWNNEKYLRGRNLFLTKIKQDNQAVICDRCDLFTKS